MAFKRFSIRGFSSEFDIRREVEGFNTTYICQASLYRGRHIRRLVDRISTGVPTERGLSAATDKTWEFRDELIKRYGLEPVGVIESVEAANRR